MWTFYPYLEECRIPNGEQVHPKPNPNYGVSMITNAIKQVSGTAGEALEMRAYQKLKERYKDDSVIKAIIEGELRSAGETMESFDTYLRVKTKVQNDKISIVRAEKEAEELAKNYLGSTGFRNE